MDPSVTPTAIVRRNGVATPVDSVSITREIPRPMPGQLTGVGGVVATTGEVTWSQEELVADRVSTPWTSKTRPATGDRVEILMGVDGTNNLVFTGLVDSAPGQFSDPSFTSEIVDDIDKLGRTVSWDALALTMPPWDSTSTTNPVRQTGLTGVYVTDRCLRVGGFNATPPRDLNSVVSAPLMGCTWPEQGALMDSGQVGDVGTSRRNPPRWTSSRWGVSSFDAYAEYLPFLGTLTGKIAADTPLNITVMSGVGAGLTASGYVQAYMADGVILRIGITSARSIVGQVVKAGVTTTVVAMTEGQAGGQWSAATLRIYPSGTGWEWQIKTNLSNQGGATNAATSEVFTTAALSTVRLYAPVGTLMGGAQVSFAPLTRGSACLYRQTAVVSVGKIWYLNAIPSMPPTPALEILTKQAAAEWAGLWIDEKGVAQWRDVDRMLQGTPELELTSKDLLEVTFRSDSQDIRRRTVVAYTSMTTSAARQYRIIGHSSGRNELAPGDSIEVWLEAKNGTYWIEVDDVPHEVYRGHGATTLNRGNGTFIGFTGLNADGDEVSLSDANGNLLGSWNQKLEKVGNRLRYSCAIISLPTGVERVKLSTSSDDNSGVKRAYQDHGLPLVRVRGLVTEVEQQYVSPIVGPDWAGDYTHPGSWFVQHANQATEIGDKIAHRLKSANPVVEEVQILPNSAIKVGMRVGITETARTGVRIVGVVIAIRPSMSAGDYSMTLKLLVTSVTVKELTIREFEQWHNGLTVKQLENLYLNETVATMESNPTR